MSNFYGTEIEIWSSFGPDGISEKKWLPRPRFAFSTWSSFRGLKPFSLPNGGMMALLKLCHKPEFIATTSFPTRKKNEFWS